MQLRIADTFTDSLARLTADEQKAVKTTVYDLHVNPDAPGLSMHKLDHAKDKRFWSVRVTRDVRIIVHRFDENLLLCFVGHHDPAYQWAERRKLETHPKTGAAQLVELRETVHEIRVPVYVPSETAAEPARAKRPSKSPYAHDVHLFAGLSDDQLLSYGVPTEWLADARVATEETLFALAAHLPAEAADALLELATGGTPTVKPSVKANANPFDHPDAQRRFRAMTDKAELERALDAPWDKWTIFLHPDQRALVEKSYNGPARISGSAGTGKTIVALHRAVHLARVHQDHRVLLTTLSPTLAQALHVRMRRLVSNEPRLSERLEVASLDDVALRLHKAHVSHGQAATVATAVDIRGVLEAARLATPSNKHPLAFLLNEWTNVVDPRQLASWEAYRDAPRLGRKSRLKEAQRLVLWQVFQHAQQTLAARGQKTLATVYSELAVALATAAHPAFEHVVVDEAQDLAIYQLGLLAAMVGKRADGLFFTGDSGQRIFGQPFSWAALGVDVRGRSKHLRVNYRTSHQIRSHADRLLDAQLTDADGQATPRNDTISIFNGPPPSIVSHASQDAEATMVGTWLAARLREGFHPSELAVFVRSEAQLSRAQAAATNAGVPHHVLDQLADVAPGKITIATMHLAKGLEFRGVVVMACDAAVLPLESRILEVGDEGDLPEVYATERHLLYVACTRARDVLLVSGVAPTSEFLDDMRHIAQ